MYANFIFEFFSMTNVLFGFAECCYVENIIFKWKFFSDCLFFVEMEKFVKVEETCDEDM